MTAMISKNTVGLSNGLVAQDQAAPKMHGAIDLI
jgi:hypothetical protein